MMAFAQQAQLATDCKLSTLFSVESLELPYGVGTDALLHSRCFRFMHLQHVSVETPLLRISLTEFFPVSSFNLTIFCNALAQKFHLMNRDSFFSGISVEANALCFDWTPCLAFAQNSLHNSHIFLVMRHGSCLRIYMPSRVMFNSASDQKPTI